MLMTCSIVCHHAVYLGSALPSDAQNAATAFLTVTDALALTIPTSTTFISGGHGRAQRLPSVRLKYTKKYHPLSISKMNGRVISFSRYNMAAVCTAERVRVGQGTIGAAPGHRVTLDMRAESAARPPQRREGPAV